MSLFVLSESGMARTYASTVLAYAKIHCWNKEKFTVMNHAKTKNILVLRSRI